LFLATLAAPFCAWKPNTDILAANLALKDLLAHGKVTFPPFGDVPVNPEALRPLCAFSAQYRAGVIGPDVFPDIYVGQSSAHRDHSMARRAGRPTTGSAGCFARPAATRLVKTATAPWPMGTAFSPTPAATYSVAPT
jgi:hypothetical protein